MRCGKVQVVKSTELVIVEQTDEHHMYYRTGETGKPVDRSSNRKKIEKRFSTCSFTVKKTEFFSYNFPMLSNRNVL